MKLDKQVLGTMETNNYFILAEQTTNRLIQFLWALLLVFLFSLFCFFFVKYSVDWATTSKTELNRQNDMKLREITEQINSQYSFIKSDI